MQKYLVTVIPRKGWNFKRYIMVYSPDILNVVSMLLKRDYGILITDIIAIELYDSRVHDYQLELDKEISENLRACEVV